MHQIWSRVYTTERPAQMKGTLSKPPRNEFDAEAWASSRPTYGDRLTDQSLLQRFIMDPIGGKRLVWSMVGAITCLIYLS